MTIYKASKSFRFEKKLTMAYKKMSKTSNNNSAYSSSRSISETNYCKTRIERSKELAKCQMCIEKDETVTHFVSECSKLPQKEYKRRHDKVATAVHWSILKANILPHLKHWHEHTAEAVMEKEKVKILWEFNRAKM